MLYLLFYYDLLPSVCDFNAAEICNSLRAEGTRGREQHAWASSTVSMLFAWRCLGWVCSWRGQEGVPGVGQYLQCKVGSIHGPNIFKDTKPYMSPFLKNWPVKVLGGRCLSVWGPRSPPPCYSVWIHACTPVLIGASTKRPILRTTLPYITVLVCVIPCIIYS